MSVKISEINYKNFGKCVKMDNGIAAVIITVDIGPHIISYCLDGKENMFLEDTDRKIFRNDGNFAEFFNTSEKWYIYGGHRLWSSPESYPQSYTPDNSPVKYKINGNTISLFPKDRTEVGERHFMEITLDDNSSNVTVVHKITNISDKEIKLAPWCLTVCDKGGIHLMPQCTRPSGLLSNRHIAIWEYTDMQDERFYMNNSYITLCQTNKDKAFKIGFNNEDGWCAYLNKEQLFIKHFDFNKDAEYADYGCNFETYTNANFMEIESLGELKTLKPGDENINTEKWSLLPCSESFEPNNDQSIKSFADKYIIL